MQVSSSEGVANHTVPESCAEAREDLGEALTGVRIGWPGAPARALGRPDAVVDPSMCVTSLRGNREISPPARINKFWPASGR